MTLFDCLMMTPEGETRMFEKKDGARMRVTRMKGVLGGGVMITITPQNSELVNANDWENDPSEDSD